MITKQIGGSCLESYIGGTHKLLVQVQGHLSTTYFSYQCGLTLVVLIT